MQCAACGVVQKLLRKVRLSPAPLAFKEERPLRDLGTANPSTLEEARQVRRIDYLINLMVALIAGVAGAWAKTHLIDPAERPPAILAPNPQHSVNYTGVSQQSTGELR